MNETEFLVFEKLFQEAVKKCFGHPLTEPLSETGSKLFYNKIFEETGLVIGWKSLKNYSIFFFDKTKPENPSIATLDTLARYTANAPYTDEVSRKEKENHYPYWYEYKNRVIAGAPAEQKSVQNETSYRKFFITTGIFLLVLLTLLLFKKRNTPINYQADFNKPLIVGTDNWYVKDLESSYWEKRATNPGYLTLFTLRGDNWPDTTKQAVSIKNLVYRKIDDGCFVAELHLREFIPGARWQQAGILLMEDTSLSSKTIRLSLAYNDFFGGYKRSPELIIQAITSAGKESGKPEEIIHHLLFETDSLAGNPTLVRNFNYTSLRIEKKEKQFRFLYAGGSIANGAYREIATKEIEMHPKYIGIFALKGFIDDTLVLPAKFKSFSITANNCD